MATVSEEKKLLLFGGKGAIAGSIHQLFRDKGWRVISVTRGAGDGTDLISWNPLLAADTDGEKTVCEAGPFDAVCWAQGANTNDSFYQFDRATHESLYQANVVYILQSLHVLVDRLLLARPARLCIISSIWQNLARQDKLSYSVTKAALQGLVLSAANDLARDGHLVNAVLPGVIDTPMSRKNLSPRQIEGVTLSTQFKRLTTLQDVANATYCLCGPDNTGITGQFVNVDLGFSHVRIV